jgi:diguanylate cyclase (GGDEF)-like protein
VKTNPPHPNRTPPPSGEADELTILLTSDDAGLRAAWGLAEPPRGFRLSAAPQLLPAYLAGDTPMLVLVDAHTALEATGDLADALQAAVHRCVWTGPAEALDRLGHDRAAAAYDVLVTPTTGAVLGLRLTSWARSIQRTAALEEIGRRVESLAEQNQQLAARMAEVEAQSHRVTRQHERLDQALRRIRQVARLSREINCLDLDRITRVCVQDLPVLLDAERASLYMYEAGGDRLILQGHSPGHRLAERVDLKDNPRSPMAVALRRGELLLITEFREFEQAANVLLEREYQSQYATASCIIVPLKGGGRVRGILNLADKRGGGRFDDEIDLPVVEQIAELIGASVYNVELYQEMERRAKTDPLTSLSNRRALEEALAHETDRSRRYGSHLGVLMIDVDHLKEINDRHGHEAGDELLRNLAATIADTARSVDVPGRWTGGDEFLIVLPDTLATQAVRLGERLLERIVDRPVVRGQERLVASLSIGVAEYHRDESVDDLIRRVDAALYAAKHGGRNRIASAEEPSPK